MAYPSKSAAIAGFAFAIAAHQPVEAASFDCSLAKSRTETVICSDPKLSALDTTLAQRYKERRALLSPTGVALLTRSQRSWLHFVKTTCSNFHPAKYEEPNFCLSSKYIERLGQLASVGEKIGPFVFNRVDIYAAQPVTDATDDSGSSRGFSIQHIAYPQIDAPDTPAELAWNKKNAAAKIPGYCEEGGNADDDTDYRVGYANDHFISVAWDMDSYCHGTPHGMGGSSTDNELLAPEIHSISQKDVFGQGDQWVSLLQELFWSALLANDWQPPPNQAAEVKRQIEAAVIRPERWFFTKDGMTFRPDPYEGGCYACNPGDADLPWKAVRPLFAATSVVP